jgi:monofunctional biosynthetic peptidoglycan transglycosylase
MGLERHLSKQRILEIYLNTAEFGRGIYGVQAAAQAYWGVPAADLSVTQAAELAATLPGPVKNNPASRTDFFLRRTKKILSLMGTRYTAPSETLDAGIDASPDPETLEASPAPPPAEPLLVPEPEPAPMEQGPLPDTSPSI